MTAHGEQQLQHALSDLSSALKTIGAPWMIIGGIAVIARGVRRFTADIDAAVRGDEVQIDGLLAAFAKKRIVPRIPDAAEFARESLVLLMRHESGVELDVSLAWTDFEREAISAATTATFGSVKAPMARPEDLVVFKAIAGRGKDMDDVAALLALYPKLDLARVRARVTELAELASAPELARGLETVIMASRTRDVVRPSPPTPTKHPKPRRNRSARPVAPKRKK